MTENWYPVPRGKTYSNVGCDFRLESIDAYQDNRVFLNITFSVFIAANTLFS